MEQPLLDAGPTSRRRRRARTSSCSRSSTSPRPRPRRPTRRKPTTRTRPRGQGAPRPTQDPLKLYVRAIGDGPLLTAARGARAGPPQGRGRRGRQAPADRGEPPPRHVDHAELHEGRRAAPRPDPGGQPRPDPRGREVRLPHGLQALDLRDLVDPPGRHPRARRPGPDDPPAGARRRAGAPPDALAPRPRAEAQPRPDGRRARQRERLPREARQGAARPRRGSGRASRRRSATARASTAT